MTKSECAWAGFALGVVVVLGSVLAVLHLEPGLKVLGTIILGAALFLFGTLIGAMGEKK